MPTGVNLSALDLLIPQAWRVLGSSHTTFRVWGSMTGVIMFFE